MEPTTLQVMLQVIAVLDALGIPYLVGGLLASSLYGIPRSTNDVDLVVDLTLDHLAPLMVALEPDFLSAAVAKPVVWTLLVGSVVAAAVVRLPERGSERPAATCCPDDGLASRGDRA